MTLKPHTIDWQSIYWQFDSVQPIRQRGYVDELVGVVILSRGPGGAVGDLVYIYPADGREPIGGDRRFPLGACHPDGVWRNHRNPPGL